jgi:hypothetical protein
LFGAGFSNVAVSDKDAEKVKMGDGEFLFCANTPYSPEEASRNYEQLLSG